MGLSSAEELGRIIAMNSNKTEQLKEDVFASDVSAAMLLAPLDRFKITMTVVGNQLNYSSTAFILDHPVYGELDSSTLALDGGYASSTTSTFTYES